MHICALCKGRCAGGARGAVWPGGIRVLEREFGLMGAPKLPITQERATRHRGRALTRAPSRSSVPRRPPRAGHRARPRRPARVRARLHRRSTMPSVAARASCSCTGSGAARTTGSRLRAGSRDTIASCSWTCRVMDESAMPTPFSLDRAVEALDVALGRAAPGPVILVGHSVGGLVAAAAALAASRAHQRAGVGRDSAAPAVRGSRARRHARSARRRLPNPVALGLHGLRAGLRARVPRSTPRSPRSTRSASSSGSVWRSPPTSRARSSGSSRRFWRCWRRARGRPKSPGG